MHMRYKALMSGSLSMMPCQNKTKKKREEKVKQAHDFIPERPRHAAQPNPKYMGSEWTK
jgi:hypothetical protein